MELFRERVYGIRTGQICLAAMLLLAGLANAAEQVWRQDFHQQLRSGDSSLRHLLLDKLALRAKLQRVSDVGGPGSLREISLPMPDGSLARFRIQHSPVMEDGLARDFPEIQTFKVFGIDDPGAYGHVDMTPQGFHAMLNTSQGRVLIDPQAGASQPDRYQLRSGSGATTRRYSCGVEEHGLSPLPLSQSAMRPAARIPGQLLRYRIAVAATEEYVQRVYNPALVGQSPVQQAQTAIASVIHRVNMIFERDLGIRLVLVTNNHLLIESGGNPGFSNNSFVLFDENQDWIDRRIGSSSYDIGHIFTVGGGGLAWLGSACDPLNKARGVSGVPDPPVDPHSAAFYVDYVAHEIGHQLNAEHSFNGTTGACRSGRNQATAFEPGSGSTIMAYAGICGVEDLKNNSDAIFHAGSIAQIDAFTASPAGSCFTTVPAANPNYPVVNALANRIIPANTAFELDAIATDADAGQVLNYQWDQMDTGCPTNVFSFGTDTGFNALFRSFQQSDSARRHFPVLGTQLNGLYDDAEVVPCNTRDINLRLTARDSFSGVASANVRVSVRDTGRTFGITNLDTPQTIADGAPFDVHWQVALTDQPPISCANVDIDLMAFTAGYGSYAEHRLLTTANSGFATVQLPIDKRHPRARIRIKCSDNIFYDISGADLNFTSSDPGATDYVDNLNTVRFNNDGTTGTVAPVCGVVAQCSAPAVVEGEVEDEEGIKKGSGAFDYAWLLVLTAISLLSAVGRGRSGRNQGIQ